MSVQQIPCSALPFDDVFLLLLADMDGEIHRLQPGPSRNKMIRYQTLIAAGGYFGPRAKELLHLKWYDIIDKKDNKLWEYKTSKTRKVYFAKSFIRIADRNYRMIDPLNIHHLVLHHLDNPTAPISTRQFNQDFARYLKRFHVETENPSSHTLRKTFMMHAWNELGGNEQAYLTVGKMMGYKSKEQVMDYLGHTARDIKEAVLRFK